VTSLREMLIYADAKVNGQGRYVNLRMIAIADAFAAAFSEAFQRTRHRREGGDEWAEPGA
jgi:hypothetical protein